MICCLHVSVCVCRCVWALGEWQSDVVGVCRGVRCSICSRSVIGLKDMCLLKITCHDPAASRYLTSFVCHHSKSISSFGRTDTWREKREKRKFVCVSLPKDSRNYCNTSAFLFKDVAALGGRLMRPVFVFNLISRFSCNPRGKQVLWVCTAYREVISVEADY